jgi:hypothetical protein
MRKTFKIGEYVIGGIIEVVADKSIITINFRDMYSGKKEIVASETFAINNPNINRDMENFLTINGTSYYAGKVIKHIESKVDLPSPSGMFGW